MFENLLKERNKLILSRLKAVAHDEALTNTKVINLSAIENIFLENSNMSCSDHQALEMQHLLIAYSKVAKKRVVDDIPMCIYNQFVRQIEKNCREKLQCLDSQLAEVLYESKTVEKQRKKLTEIIEKTIKTMKVFKDLLKN